MNYCIKKFTTEAYEKKLIIIIMGREGHTTGDEKWVMTVNKPMDWKRKQPIRNITKRWVGEKDWEKERRKNV